MATERITIEAIQNKIQQARKLRGEDELKKRNEFEEKFLKLLYDQADQIMVNFPESWEEELMGKEGISVEKFMNNMGFKYKERTNGQITYEFKNPFDFT